MCILFSLIPFLPLRSQVPWQGTYTKLIMDHALDTVELLELVLLELDIQTLLTSASCVSKFWNSVIQQSTKLQSALFFRPSPVPHSLVSDHDNNNNNKKKENTPPIRTNSFLLSRLQHLLSHPQSPPSSSNNDDKTSSPTPTQGRPGPSWSTMLLQQPPARKLGVWKLDTGYGLYHGFEMKTEMFEFHSNNKNDNQSDDDDDDDDRREPLTMGWLVHFLQNKARPQGYSWDLFVGDEGMARIEREKRSLFMTKSARKEQQALVEMWTTADVVLKLTRWHQGV